MDISTFYAARNVMREESWNRKYSKRRQQNDHKICDSSYIVKHRLTFPGI